MYKPFFFFIILLASPALGDMIGGHQLRIDFTKASDAGQKASWAKPDEIAITEKGLGWDGPENSSYDGWIMTVPFGTGISWRPANTVYVKLSITPAPKEITLPDGRKQMPFEGWAYARFSADAKHWSTWQAMTRDDSAIDKQSRNFMGVLSVPYRERADYDALRLDFARRQDVPWDSDEEDLARRLVQNDPDYFKEHIPFAGYVQYLFEGSFHGGERFTGLNARADFVVSGMHHEATDPAAAKNREGPWRFKVSGALPTTNPTEP